MYFGQIALKNFMVHSMTISRILIAMLLNKGQQYVVCYLSLALPFDRLLPLWFDAHSCRSHCVY